MNTLVQTQNNTTTRKIFIYELKCKKKSEDIEYKFPYIIELFKDLSNEIYSIDYDKKSESRWYGIEEITVTNNEIRLIFMNCKYNYKPNIININSRTQRENSKQDDEGDKEKTHIYIKENMIAFEYKRNGTSISVFDRLINSYWKKINDKYDKDIISLKINQIIDDNFLDIIKKSNRIKNLKIKINSSLFGSEYYNASNDNNVEDTIILEVKAKKQKSLDKIKIIDKIESWLVKTEEVKKVTLDINDEDNNHRIINNEEISQQYTINVMKNKNGEVVSEDIFNKMSELI